MSAPKSAAPAPAAPVEAAAAAAAPKAGPAAAVGAAAAPVAAPQAAPHAAMLGVPKAGAVAMPVGVVAMPVGGGVLPAPAAGVVGAVAVAAPARDPAAERIANLKAERARLVSERKEVQKELRLEEKKRQRILARARNLSTDDLAAVIVARGVAAAAKAKAEAKAGGDGKGKGKGGK